MTSDPRGVDPSSGVPTDAPSVLEGRDIGVTLGQIGVMECEADGVPDADFEWYKDDRR